MEEKTTYEAYIFCKNCHHREKMVILKGYRVEDTVCSNCGNITLEIDPNGKLSERPRRTGNFK